MITLEQIRALEARVEKAVKYIDTLKSENSMLRTKLSGYEKRVGELEAAVREFQTEQSRIEEGIVKTLERLNEFEDAVIAKETSSVQRKNEIRPSAGSAAAESEADDKSVPEEEAEEDSSDNKTKNDSELEIF